MVRVQAPLLAFLSGIPALIYQVVWAREVGLLAGVQLDAVATVVATYFGGLAAGARWLGPRADLEPRPLRWYAGLEAAAALLAVVATLGMRALGSGSFASGPGVALALCGLAILPTTFALGGTQPALLRSTGTTHKRAVLPTGQIQGFNAAGAVVGVGLATWSIPTIGLWATLTAGAALGISVGVVALLLDRGRRPLEVAEPTQAGGDAPLPLGLLALAAAAGAVTLGYEVVATRMAAVRLGSSLYAWATVLALFLGGLAAGNLAAAPTAGRTRRAAERLVRIEIACSVALGLALLAIHPPLARSATGLTTANLGRVVAGVLPGALCMGAAFPFFARLVLDARPGRSFGALAAANTAGGIAGALLVPLALLPLLGLLGTTLLASAGALAVALGVLRLTDAGETARARVRTTVLAASAFLVAGGAGGIGAAMRQPAGAIHVEHGRNASVAVVARGGERELIVDGDLEAHTDWGARRAEELLAAIPLAVHPRPGRVLEIGFGAGITLGAAASFPVDRIECVEISNAVVRAAPWMAPANRGVLDDERVTIVTRDARSFLRGVDPVYDVIVANTLHPWSLGATGLYSVEYFARLRGGLAEGGIATQWLPASGLRAESFRSILRSFFEAFPEGWIFWGEDNVILLGAARAIPLPSDDAVLGRVAASQLDAIALGLGGPLGDGLALRRIGRAEHARSASGRAELLHDDRPRLEADAARGASLWDPGIHRLLIAIIDRAIDDGAASEPLRVWLSARAARLGSDPDAADALLEQASELGLGLARRGAARRVAARAADAMTLGSYPEAMALFDEAEAIAPGLRRVALARSSIAQRRQETGRAVEILESRLATHPVDPETWNQLANVHSEAGNVKQAERAIERALEHNPFFPEALANAGLLAMARGDRSRALAMRERLAAIEHGSPRPELQALDAALAR